MHAECTLSETTGDDIDELMRWFPDAQSVAIWGGPDFRFPFTRETFAEDCGLDMMRSFALKNSAGGMVAFGQYYYRHGRGHLARLVTRPDRRRQGYGARLIEALIDAVAAEGKAAEVSLFVYRDNVPANRCYRSLGFSEHPYPADASLEEKCYFLTRAIEFEEPKASTRGRNARTRR